VRAFDRARRDENLLPASAALYDLAMGIPGRRARVGALLLAEYLAQHRRAPQPRPWGR
jgi:hypothetical protein